MKTACECVMDDGTNKCPHHPEAEECSEAATGTYEHLAAGAVEVYFEFCDGCGKAAVESGMFEKTEPWEEDSELEGLDSRGNEIYDASDDIREREY